MKNLILCTLAFFLMSVNLSFAQSVYFFKTTKTLELEKWDAQEASKSAVANSIANELSSRAKEQQKIDDLQAEIDKKLQSEDYFGAEKINKEIERLKSVQSQAHEIRENIEDALRSEDFANAEKLKNDLLELLQTTPTPSTTASQSSSDQKSVVSSSSSDLKDAFTSSSTNSSKPSGLFVSTSGNTDKYGRTAAENTQLHNKRRKTGIALLCVGGALIIPSATLIGLSVSGSSDVIGPVGAVTGIASLALIIPGAAILGSSRKYKKRAEQLLSGTASLRPSVINAHSFNGGLIDDQLNYGLTLNYTF